MDFVQRGHDCGHDIELGIQSCQYSRIGHHAHRQIPSLDSDDFLPGQVSLGGESSLSQPTVKAALSKLLAETLCD